MSLGIRGVVGDEIDVAALFVQVVSGHKQDNLRLEVLSRDL
jgi:hypothetical protein